MTPKEKAIDLVQQFYNNQCSHSISELSYKSAKKCALIAVDEILKFGSQLGIREPMMYWQKVKQEINKL